MRRKQLKPREYSTDEHARSTVAKSSLMQRKEFVDKTTQPAHVEQRKNVPSTFAVIDESLLSSAAPIILFLLGFLSARQNLYSKSPLGGVGSGVGEGSLVGVGSDGVGPGLPSMA